MAETYDFDEVRRQVFGALMESTAQVDLYETSVRQMLDLVASLSERLATESTQISLDETDIEVLRQCLALCRLRDQNRRIQDQLDRLDAGDFGGDDDG